MEPKITIACADVVEFDCDVLVLKYAQKPYGADKMVVQALQEASPNDTLTIAPRPGSYHLQPSNGGVVATQILFVGVGPLYQFTYQRIREFAGNALQKLKAQVPEAKHVAMTIHGMGYGLDEREAFLAQLAGLLDAFASDKIPPALEHVTIVEHNWQRATRLQKVLDQYVVPTSLKSSPVAATAYQPPPQPPIDAGIASNAKPHIFVAMPFSDDMEDVYVFGIQGPVNAAGYLCERVDMAIFTGDILQHICTRIETADLVMANLTGANANVYLEVGYAWGKGRPTLLLARSVEELKFDVQNHRCLIYKNITDLAKKLTADLARLAKPSKT